MSDPNFCEQRAILQKYNKPLPRFSLDSINPYLKGNITKNQLDMRRKVEILKYNPSRVSTQTNSFTKKQQYSMLIKGSFVQQPTPTSSKCDEIPTPTTACDVPGPVMYLYSDPAVPIYNLSNYNVRSYSESVNDTLDLWQLVSLPDVSLNNSITNYLMFYNTIDVKDQPFYTFSITIPVGIYVSGISTRANLPGKITARIKSASLESYYNNKLYGTYASPTFDTNVSLVFDVSNSSPGAFSASYFVGNATFSNIRLYASPTFVYSFKSAFTLEITVINDSYYSSVSYFGANGLTCNAVVNMTSETDKSNGAMRVISSSGNKNLGSFVVGVNT